jgi:ribose transport system ATP-binding protein
LHAEAQGVHIVQQELNLIPTLSVAENLFLNRMPNRWGMLRRRVLYDRAIDALRLVGLEDVAPDTPVGRLGVGQQQLVEIGAALSRNCRLLILDEPTAALTDPQIDRLFTHIERLRQSDVGVIYISHRMDELRRIADRATILRDGRVVCAERMDNLSTDQIVHLLAGKEVERESHHSQRKLGPVRLQVNELSRGDQVQQVHFHVRAGEIFGIAGLVGSGRTELLRAIFGADRAESGHVGVGESQATQRFKTPRAAVAAGMAMIPEDRRHHGLLLSQSVRDNVTLGNLPAFRSVIGTIRSAAERNAAQQYCRTMDVQCHGLQQRVDHLSGGNQQKVVMARWLMRDAEVYLFDEPTRGIDVSAKATVYHLLNELAGRGRAVVVVSSELRELLAICDRIGVMSAGKMTEIFARGEWSQEKIMDAALRGYSQ